jgi:SAM-dependent methyltransferase
VLELGAKARSTLSPFLVARGANSTVTCYSEGELPKLDETLSQLAQQYGLARERLRAERADIFALDQKARFDLVMLKSVLGGVNRQHDQAEFRKAVSNCLSILNPNGHLLIIDKARSLKVIHWMLRRLGKGGKKGWHYFTFDELKQLIPNGSFESSFAAHGILSFGNFGGGIFQKIADFLDEHYVEKLVTLEKRVVFSLTCAMKVKPDTVA